MSPRMTDRSSARMARLQRPECSQLSAQPLSSGAQRICRSQRAPRTQAFLEGRHQTCRPEAIFAQAADLLASGRASDVLVICGPDPPREHVARGALPGVRLVSREAFRGGGVLDMTWAGPGAGGR